MEHTGESERTLADDLREVADQAESLLQALASTEGDARIEALRERVLASVDAARARLADIELEANRAASRVAAALDRWIGDNPWTTLAIAASIGFVAGVLLVRGGGLAASRRVAMSLNGQ
jgi:ElaB/YqjD/DUF883 family membrane-anchored ribosome-binding protein